MSDLVLKLKEFLHGTILSGWPWLERAAGKVIDLFAGPLTGENTRYYWVYMLQALLVLAVVYVARTPAGQRDGLGGFWRFCLPARVVGHASTWVDLKVNVANFFLGSFFKVFWRLNGTFLAAGLVDCLVWAFGPAPHALEWTPLAALLVTLLVAVADDFGYYAFHVASHRIPFLWAFHKVHHTAEALTPLTAGRVHPVEMALSEPVRAAAAALVIAPAVYLFAGDVSLATVFGINVVALVFAGFGDQLFHSEVRISWGPVLDRIFVSPAVHQIHHSALPQHWHRNMGGILSVWDWMFGTLHVPVPGERVVYGLVEGERQIHTGVLATYLLPFWDAMPARGQLLAVARRVAGPVEPDADAGPLARLRARGARALAAPVLAVPTFAPAPTGAVAARPTAPGLLDDHLVPGD